MSSLLKWPGTSTQIIFCEYMEILKNTCIEVETLENEIYSCFLMSEVILTGKSKKVYWNSFTVKGIWYSVKH